MKCSMTGQEKGDCLIEVTAWTGLTVNDFDNYNSRLFEPNIFTFLLGWFPLIFESSFKDGVILLGRGNDQRVEIPSIKSPLFDSIIWTWIFFFLFFNLEKILSLPLFWAKIFCESFYKMPQFQYVWYKSGNCMNLYSVTNQRRLA